MVTPGIIGVFPYLLRILFLKMSMNENKMFRAILSKLLRSKALVRLLVQCANYRTYSPGESEFPLELFTDLG